jgi:hypothetical protein
MKLPMYLHSALLSLTSLRDVTDVLTMTFSKLISFEIPSFLPINVAGTHAGLQTQ